MKKICTYCSLAWKGREEQDRLAAEYGRDAIDFFFKRIDRPYSYRDMSPEAKDFYNRYVGLLRQISMCHCNET